MLITRSHTPLSGMGPDPIGLRSYGDRLGIVTQAFSEITRDYPRLPEIT